MSVISRAGRVAGVNKPGRASPATWQAPKLVFKFPRGAQRGAGSSAPRGGAVGSSEWSRALRGAARPRLHPKKTGSTRRSPRLHTDRGAAAPPREEPRLLSGGAEEPSRFFAAEPGSTPKRPAPPRGAAARAPRSPAGSSPRGAGQHFWVSLSPSQRGSDGWKICHPPRLKCGLNVRLAQRPLCLRMSGSSYE